MRLLSIVGARPQFIKIAPIVRRIDRRQKHGAQDLEHLLVHTGQHYDAAMSDVFFEDLDLPAADFNLGVGSGSHGSQTGLMLARIEEVLLDVKPDAVLVYGDTNSTLAGALASAKLHFPVAHVEAGLRSFRRDMPEEINRIVADHVCDLLLAPTAAAVAHLHAEGLSLRTVLTGDVMYDSVQYYRQMAQARSIVGKQFGISPGSYAVATVHRAENADSPERLSALLATFNRIAAQGTTVVFPLHPRTRQRIGAQFEAWAPHPRVMLVDPVRYLDMLWLVDNAAMLLTDSGGLQKEALFLGCPCVTLRDETEWVETIQIGGNILTGVDPDRIVAAVEQWRAVTAEARIDFSRKSADAFGRGQAADSILNAVARLQARGRDPQLAIGSHGIQGG